MAQRRRQAAWKMPSVSAWGLKLFTTIVLLLGSIGVIIVEKGLINLDSYTQISLAEAMEADSHLVFLAGVGSVLQLLAGLAVPLCAFFLVEGFLHTGSFSRYLGTMAFFALLSEVAYDFAMSGRLLDFSSQNAMVGLCLCLVMLYFMRMLEHFRPAARGILQLLVAVCAVFWVSVLRAEYGLATVLLTAILYCFRDHRGLQFLLGILVSLIHVTGPLAFYGIYCYSGERNLKCSKYVFYFFYPVHLFVLGMITRYFLL